MMGILPYHIQHDEKARVKSMHIMGAYIMANTETLWTNSQDRTVVIVPSGNVVRASSDFCPEREQRAVRVASTRRRSEDTRGASPCATVLTHVTDGFF